MFRSGNVKIDGQLSKVLLCALCCCIQSATFGRFDGPFRSLLSNNIVTDLFSSPAASV